MMQGILGDKSKETITWFETHILDLRGQKLDYQQFADAILAFQTRAGFLPNVVVDNVDDFHPYVRDGLCGSKDAICRVFYSDEAKTMLYVSVNDNDKYQPHCCWFYNAAHQQAWHKFYGKQAGSPK